LNRIVRSALECWLVERENKLYGLSKCPAIFISNQGKRLSPATIDFLVARLGWTGRLELSSQVLRDTFLTNIAPKKKNSFLSARLDAELLPGWPEKIAEFR